MTASSIPLAAARAAPAAPAARAGRRYAVAIARDWASIAPAWAEAFRQGAATPFQHATWLEAWYGAVAARRGVAPLLVTVTERATGALAMMLPLIELREGRRRVIAFADLGLTDFNAPVLGPAAPRDRAGARVLWQTLVRALPRADLLRFAKMPLEIAGLPNPLSLLPRARSCGVTGNLVTAGDDWDAYRRSLGRVVRKELERSWRVFERHPDARFARITDTDEARRVLAALEAHQTRRMRGKGAEYQLDDPAFAQFYRDLVATGLADGSVRLTALLVGETVVASLLGITDGETYVMIRIANAGGAWSNCSPGRLIIERSMAALHAEGLRRFDFSIGDYDYKRRFGVMPVPLADLVVARGWRGLAGEARAIAADRLRRSPALAARLRPLVDRWRG